MEINKELKMRTLRAWLTGKVKEIGHGLKSKKRGARLRVKQIFKKSVLI